MQVCISYLFIFVPVINEEYYEKDKNIIALVRMFVDFLISLW